MPRSASACGLGEERRYPTKQLYTKRFTYNTVILVWDPDNNGANAFFVEHAAYSIAAISLDLLIVARPSVGASGPGQITAI